MCRESLTLCMTRLHVSLHLYCQPRYTWRAHVHNFSDYCSTSPDFFICLLFQVLCPHINRRRPSVHRSSMLGRRTLCGFMRGCGYAKKSKLPGARAAPLLRESCGFPSFRRAYTYVWNYLGEATINSSTNSYLRGTVR